MSVHLRFLSFVCFLFLGSVGFLASAEAQDQSQVSSTDIKDRLNKIFYWHLSDELKLTPDQEQAVVKTLEDVQKKREAALQLRESALTSLRKLPKDAPLSETKPLLDQYLGSLERLAGLDRKEYTSLKDAMGEELLGRFYIIRDDVTTRVRKALRQ